MTADTKELSEEQVRVSKEILEQLGRKDLTPTGSYEQRRKAFKAAGRNRGSSHIPMTRNNQNFFPTTAQGNNRRETNKRGVNPRMLNIQRAPVQEKIIVGTTNKNSKAEPVVALVKTTSMRKVYHTRPVVSAVVPE